MLIIVCGLPGSGKSSFSRELSKHFSAVHLNSDVIRKELFTNPVYTDEEKAKVYEEMAARAERHMKEKRNVILDATFFQKRYRDMMRGVAEKSGEKTHTLLCVLEEGKTKGRLTNRRPGVSDADYEVYLKLKGKFEPISGDHLEIDSSLPMKEMISKARDFIEGE